MTHGNNFVIDKLKLCYLGTDAVLSNLSNVEIGEYYEYAGFCFYRIIDDYFRFCFNIFNIREIGKVVARLKYGHNTDVGGDINHIYYQFENFVFYDHNVFADVIALPEKMGFVFNNFTAIDIALDTRFNTSTIIKRMLRDREITTIINGKVIKNPKKVLPEIVFQYSTSLERLQAPSISIKQKKAKKLSNQGVEVQTYDKISEIANSSHKTYILKYYDWPKRLFRTEVRLHYQELKDYFIKKKITPVPETIFNKDILTDMFLYHLQSVLRFRKGQRKKILWKDLLKIH